MEILLLNYNSRNTWEWAAVDTLVRLTKANVHAVHITGRIRETTAIDALVENTTVNVDTVQTIGQIRETTAVDALVEYATANVDTTCIALSVANL